MGSSCRVLSYEITYNVRIRFELLLGIDEIIQIGVLKLTIFQVIYLMYNLYREYLFYPKRSSKSDQCSNSRDA